MKIFFVQFRNLVEKNWTDVSLGVATIGVATPSMIGSFSFRFFQFEFWYQFALRWWRILKGTLPFVGLWIFWPLGIIFDLRKRETYLCIYCSIFLCRERGWRIAYQFTCNLLNCEVWEFLSFYLRDWWVIKRRGDILSGLDH